MINNAFLEVSKKMSEILLSTRIYLPLKNVKVLDSLIDKSGTTSRNKVIEKIVKEFLDDKLATRKLC